MMTVNHYIRALFDLFKNGAKINVLPIERQSQIISAAVKECSIRAIERMTGTHRDTIMRLGVRISQGCKILHYYLFQNLEARILEFGQDFCLPSRAGKRITS